MTGPEPTEQQTDYWTDLARRQDADTIRDQFNLEAPAEPREAGHPTPLEQGGTPVSCRTGPDTPHPPPPDTPKASIAARIEREPFLDYPLLPGMGEPGADCGGAHVPTFCADCGHPEVRPLGCDRWACPDCYARLRSRELRRKLTRLLARDLDRFLDDNPGAPARAWATHVLERDETWLDWHHAIASPPERTDDQLLDEDAHKRLRSRANDLAKQGGLEGHLGYVHPYAIAKDLKPLLRESGHVGGTEGGMWTAARDDVLGLGTWEAYAVPSPHVHLLGHSGDDRWLEPGDQVGDADEIFHAVEDDAGAPLVLDPERLKRTIGYLLSHTAVPEESLQRATYAGDLRKNLGAADTWLSPRALEVLEEVVDQLLEEDPAPEGACSDCGSTHLRSIWDAIDVIQDRERAGDPLEHERALRRAYWLTARPDDVPDPPPEDADVDELADWIHRDEPLVLDSEIPQPASLTAPRPCSEATLEGVA